MTFTSKVLAVLLLAFALAGCGQSGPLYVPGDPSSVKQPPQPAASDEGEDNGDDDER